ncbi:cell morphogenesis protein Las1 [Trypanosoma conorhini]|uniref:Cell morphogenesis protein Las1 n=1 Tax=Trypanosoma conorhini TaxID=83891 RepID=A0A3R7N7D5_9TRYP|nr:cell morphogenesis protein Las1 [Trypanosoma conorhini]RNF01506.1 cell morphogenesis protein Las1 [Trypanosoma conorhini]
MARKRNRDRPTALNERRKRGTCIKRGLGELDDLDAAPPSQTPACVKVQTGAAAPKCLAGKASTDTSNMAVVSGALAAEEEDVFPSAPLSSSFSSAPSVFGRGWDEWKCVKQLLFAAQDGAGATEARRKALDRIQLVWKARERKHRPLPAYAEATALLMEAVLLDEGGHLSSSGAVSFYGAAISRSVHLMTGTFARGAADTYRKRARMIGFPEEAVEVRQRVAHGALPLLSELRWVCGLVLQFLFQHYWVEQERHLRLMEAEEEEEAEVAEDDAMSAAEPQHNAQSTTVEEMRQLLEDLSEVSEGASTDASGPAEVAHGGWQLC